MRDTLYQSLVRRQSVKIAEFNNMTGLFCKEYKNVTTVFPTNLFTHISNNIRKFSGNNAWLYVENSPNDISNYMDEIGLECMYLQSDAEYSNAKGQIPTFYYHVPTIAKNIEALAKQYGFDGNIPYMIIVMYTYILVYVNISAFNKPWFINIMPMSVLPIKILHETLCRVYTPMASILGGIRMVNVEFIDAVVDKAVSNTNITCSLITKYFIKPIIITGTMLTIVLYLLHSDKVREWLKMLAAQ